MHGCIDAIFEHLVFNGLDVLPYAYVTHPCLSAIACEKYSILTLCYCITLIARGAGWEKTYLYVFISTYHNIRSIAIIIMWHGPLSVANSILVAS